MEKLSLLDQIIEGIVQVKCISRHPLLLISMFLCLIQPLHLMTIRSTSSFLVSLIRLGFLSTIFGEKHHMPFPEINPVNICKMSSNFYPCKYTYNIIWHNVNLYNMLFCSYIIFYLSKKAKNMCGTNIGNFHIRWQYYIYFTIFTIILNMFKNMVLVPANNKRNILFNYFLLLQLLNITNHILSDRLLDNTHNFKDNLTTSSIISLGY